METIFAAHIHINEDGSTVIQSIQDHCNSAGRIAGECLRTAGLTAAARLAGKHHDDGKRTVSYQTYLNDAVQGKTVKRGSVIHTFTGVRFFLENFHAGNRNLYEKLTAELLAYAIGAHHGTFDIVDLDGNSGFQHRLAFSDTYAEAIDNMWMEGTSQKQIEDEFQKAVEEVKQVVGKLRTDFFQNPPAHGAVSQQNDSLHNLEINFYFGLLARLLSSAVIEGDRQDTWAFSNQISLPDERRDMGTIWQTRLAYLEAKLRQLPRNSPISHARLEISERCFEAAEYPQGVFRLNVPTGAGKTLGSLRFALAHAKKWNCSRIIVTTPLLSILEQNAAVLREYIGDDSLILEHHSNVVKPDEEKEKLSDRDLLEESWSAPIIITTLVQLLNTLFSGKTASIRRFHSLCGSVIIIDETQTVPLKMISLFDLAINFLVSVCRASVVLCSATQPCLEETTHPVQVPLRDMVPYTENLWKPFCRTELKDAGQKRLEEIPQMVAAEMVTARSLLLICNKKDQARRLYCELKSGPWECVHLSAAMCPAHRNYIIQKLKGSREGKVVCVSTQVIEAGVDVSFERVIRFTAGLDNAVQAAGRCNRNGESSEVQPVYLVNCADERLGKLPEIQRSKTASIELMEHFRRDTQRYGADLSGNQAVRDYYRLLYRELPEGYQDDVVDGQSLYSLLSLNRPPQDTQGEKFYLQQAFKTAGKEFQVFEEETTSALVPYEEGKKLIQELSSSYAEHDLGFTKQILEKAKPYFVSLYSYQVEALRKKGALYQDSWGRVWILDAAFYDEDVGFSIDNPQNQFLEV